MLSDHIPTLGLEISRRLDPPDEDTTHPIGRLLVAMVAISIGAGCVWMAL